ncbi:MAG TPA: FAD-dependent thymidylate synthase, partial [Candidatus Binatia bacterium]|nr:FAD-dependent thymidylate synthase [Candidatus Binatia bacterium]
MEVRYPRFIHSEMMTHRVFCLAEGTELFFDLPVGTSYKTSGKTRLYKLKIEDFYKKWYFGSRSRASNRRRPIDLDHIEGEKLYSTSQLASVTGYRRLSLSHACRVEGLPHSRHAAGKTLRIAGSAFRQWYETRARALHRFALRSRLENMQLRQCNEDSCEIEHTTIRNIVYSGEQPVYRIRLENGYEITATENHRFLTDAGWLTLRDALGLEHSPLGAVVCWAKRCNFGVNGVPAYRDPAWLEQRRRDGLVARQIAESCGASIDQIKYQFRKHGIRGDVGLVRRHLGLVPWNKGKRYANPKLQGRSTSATVVRGERSHFWRGGITSERKLIGQWTRLVAPDVHRTHDYKCAICLSGRNLHAHHVDPVYRNPAKARDVNNLKSLCNSCHTRLHARHLELELLKEVESCSDLREFWHKYGSVHNERPEATKGHKQKLMLLNFAAPVSVEFVGFRKTYDVSVTGKFENFVADGFVVHNSRNAASSRAIPIKKMILAVRNEPAMPIFWGKNQSGMAARSEISRQAQELAIEEWQRALLNALAAAERLSESDIDLHKQLVNRLLEPFAWITVIITATEWANFFTQRCHPDAQPEIQTIANEMLAAFRQSQPVPVSIGAWHLPLIQEDERSLPTEMLKKISVARCAR